MTNETQQSTETPQYRAEFPDFPVMPEAARLEQHGFEDSSWHNDMCPSWTRVIRTDSEGLDDLQIRVWMEHPDRNEREMGPEAPRFIVVVFDRDDEYGALIETEDFEAALQYALADILTEPEAQDLFAVIRDASGGAPRYEDASARFNIRIYSWDGEATLVDEIDGALADRAFLNDWYREHVGYRPDDDSATPLQTLVGLVAAKMLLAQMDVGNSGPTEEQRLP